MKIGTIDSLHFIVYKLLEPTEATPEVKQKISEFVQPLGIFLSKMLEETTRPSEVWIV